MLNFLSAWGNVLVMVVILLILPTADVFTDIKLEFFWSSSRPPWALAILCIIPSHTDFIFYLWYQLEPREKKKFSWIFVIFQVFPQYRAASIIYHTVMSHGKDVVQNRKSTYERILNCVEPFLESIPQVIVCTASLFSAWGKLTGNLDDAKTLIEVTGGSTEDLTPGWVDIPWNFAVPFALSLISASYGIVKFYKDGPLGFIDTSGILSGTISIMFFVNLVGTMSFMVWRLMMMASMITSTGYLIPLLFSPNVDLFSGQCSSLSHQLPYFRHQLLAELYGPLQTAPA